MMGYANLLDMLRTMLLLFLAVFLWYHLRTLKSLALKVSSLDNALSGIASNGDASDSENKDADVADKTLRELAKMMRIKEADYYAVKNSYDYDLPPDPSLSPSTMRHELESLWKEFIIECADTKPGDNPTELFVVLTRNWPTYEQMNVPNPIVLKDDE